AEITDAAAFRMPGVERVGSGPSRLIRPISSCSTNHGVLTHRVRRREKYPPELLTWRARANLARSMLPASVARLPVRAQQAVTHVNPSVAFWNLARSRVMLIMQGSTFTPR